jgi:hypothetical protein
MLPMISNYFELNSSKPFLEHNKKASQYTAFESALPRNSNLNIPRERFSYDIKGGVFPV